MKKIRLPFTFRYLLAVYLTGLAFFTGFRLLLLVHNIPEAQELPAAAGLLARAFWMGWRFDTVISGYLLLLPCLLLYAAELGRFLSRRFLLGVHWLLGVLYLISLFGLCTDIPFYQNYHTRLNASVLNWTATPGFMLKMVLEEKAFLVYLLLFLLAGAVFTWLWRRIYRRYAGLMTAEYNTSPQYPSLIAITLLSLGLLFLGIRGRTAIKTPIQVGTAFFSPYNFPNQLGLNPLFTFIRSYLDRGQEGHQYLKLMDETQALNLVQQYLQLPVPPPYPAYPLARDVSAAVVAPEKYNVVLVLMESMSASFMQRYGNEAGLTPFLDSLSRQAYCFDHFYSSGIHTYNGIFSTLYGFPALLDKHSMYADVIPACTGLPYLLKQNGYHNLFFITHDDQFDNIGPFLTVNHFDEIKGEKDFPSSEVISTLGIPDHKLFGHLLNRLDEVNGSGKPFFAVAMTGSNHNPFKVPGDIALRLSNGDQREGCVRYADWSLEQFMAQAAAKSWYRNTIFVFLGDHGAIQYNDMYADMSYAYSHIPLLVFRPGVQPKAIDVPGSQADVCATVCGMLGLSYTNNTMGIDLLQQQRPFTTFSADDKIAAADKEHIYVWHRDGREHLFRLNGNYTEDILGNCPAKADSMKQFILATTQVTQWLLANDKAGPVKR